MKKYAIVMVAVALLLGFGTAAHAEIRPQIKVKLPFAFEAGGVTLPAGTYTVLRFSDQPFDTLMLTSEDKGTSIFIHPAEMENAGDYKPKVTFHRVGDERFLTSIETPDYLYNFNVSPALLQEAAARQQQQHPGVPASSSGGSK